MKKREIILDFTSLLDVTLIVIFFFVLFSHLDSEQNKIQTQEKIEEYNAEIQKAEDREAEADKHIKQLENEIQTVREYSEKHASNVKEMIEFGRSENIKILLEINNSERNIRVVKGQDVLLQMDTLEGMGKELLNVMAAAGYTTEDTIFCDFVFDSLKPGSNSAHRDIIEALSEVRTEYGSFYYSETDMAVGKD